jgi:glycosyltransferase involved in cell wall biosynthesis
MRVLFLAHAYPRFAGDPVGSFILRLAVSLRAEGVEVTVLAPAAPDVASRDVIEGVPVHRFRYAPRRLETLAYTGTMGAQVRRSWMARVALVAFLASALRSARQLVRRDAITLIHAHWWFPAGVVGAATRAVVHVPLVTTFHGSDVRLADAFPGAARLFRAVARRSDALTCVSTWLGQIAARLDPTARPIVAPMPIVPDLFHPGTSRAADRILFVGKLSEQKGLHHLLRALTLMRARPMVDVVGAGRVPDGHVRNLAAELGLSDRINWLPLLAQEELAELYRRAAVHVIPAVDEGLGLTAAEALLSETPVVAFESGGVTDVVVNERTGLLVPTGDHAALAAAIDRMLSDGDLRTRLGRAGREEALATFGPRAVARRYEAIYRQVLGAPARQ